MVGFSRISRVLGVTVLGFGLTACSGGDRDGGLPPNEGEFQRDYDSAARAQAEARGSSVFDLFENNDDPNVTVEVNKYIWNAALDILDFMPLQGADPFTGTIVMGYGAPRGGGRAYRATVYVTDPALDARSLRVSLLDRNSRPVSAETQRAVEDAILTRARQLRIADSKL